MIQKVMSHCIAWKWFKNMDLRSHSVSLFIIFEDAASSELISKDEYSYIKLGRFCRMMHIRCAIYMQAVWFYKELKW